MPATVHHTPGCVAYVGGRRPVARAMIQPLNASASSAQTMRPEPPSLNASVSRANMRSICDDAEDASDMRTAYTRAHTPSRGARAEMYARDGGPRLSHLIGAELDGLRRGGGEDEDEEPRAHDSEER